MSPISIMGESSTCARCARVTPLSRKTESQFIAKPCGNLRIRLVMACVDERWLAMSSVQFDRAQICTQVNGSF